MKIMFIKGFNLIFSVHSNFKKKWFYLDDGALFFLLLNIQNNLFYMVLVLFFLCYNLDLVCKLQ